MAGLDPSDAALTLLLPAREQLTGIADAASPLARLLARGDAAAGEAGDEAQLLRHFDVLPRGLPVAALMRQYDLADADGRSWLRADPAHVRADLGAGRLLACGELGLDEAEAAALLAPLKPLFGDDGCPISAGAPSRWYLSLPRDARLPTFAAPARVLGDDIYAHLPEGDLGRRWRRLLSEAQVTLHNHPINAQRVRDGRLPVNSLWFWGGGALPDHVRSAHRRVASDDLMLAALARPAGIERSDRPAEFASLAAPAGTLLDLRRLRARAELDRAWLVPALAAQARGSFAELRLDFADGQLLTWRRAHRWRVWRRVRT